MKMKAKQKGLSLTSWIFIIAVGLFFGLLGINMVPSYLEFYSISNVIESLKADPQTNKASVHELTNAFDRRIDVNGIYNFDKKWLHISKDLGKTIVEVKYEVRKPVAGNVDVVMSFHKKLEW